MIIQTIKWVGDEDGQLELLDQRKLPLCEEFLVCTNPAMLAEAIRTLAVRGAPAIGVAAAYGICLALKEIPDETAIETALEHIDRNIVLFSSSRPTAVNLFRALDRMKRAAFFFATEAPAANAGRLKQVLLSEARLIQEQDRRMCLAIGEHGRAFVPDNGAVLTHCNAGVLATAGIGTALAPLYVASRAGKHFCVYVDETRPLLQGGRLTCWELSRAGIEAILICDSAAGGLLKQGVINAVFVGADRIAANGDTANKIGSLGLSVLAGRFGVPFYVAAPSSTFDLSIPDGRCIPIEHRDGQEVRCFGRYPVAPEGVKVYNPAFDVIDAADITAIITEKGVIYKPGAESIKSHLGG